MTSATLDTPTSAIAHPAPKLALAGAVALAGDRLFYDHALGISLALFLALLAAAAWIANRGRVRGREGAVALTVLAAGLAPLVESLTVVSLASGVTGLALFGAVLTGGLGRGLRATCAAAGRMVFTGPLRLFPDAWATAHRAMRDGRRPRAATLLGWVVPVVLCAVFAGLFASANPLIDAFVSGIPWSAPLSGLDLVRILLWVLLLAVAWAFVAPRVVPGLRKEPQTENAATPAATPATTPLGDAAGRLLDPATIRRCLMLFNLLFAVQSATDIAYLWAGLALPDGLTYAAYAHRGAYPLVATALLAAAFVLVALRPGGAGENSRVIRRLVTLWIAQNVLLVASAMLRLDLYVAAYALTFTRLAAFVWMGLVAVGLVLILARIAFRLGNGWLIGANGLALALTLYACAFVNAAGLIAEYNVAHRREAGGSFDLGYAMSLGAAAIPAVDRVLAEDALPPAENVALWRKVHAWNLGVRMRDWRAWTFRDQRLLDYLAAHPTAPVPGASTNEDRQER